MATCRRVTLAVTRRKQNLITKKTHFAHFPSQLKFPKHSSNRINVFFKILLDFESCYFGQTLTAEEKLCLNTSTCWKKTPFIFLFQPNDANGSTEALGGRGAGRGEEGAEINVMHILQWNFLRKTSMIEGRLYSSIWLPANSSGAVTSIFFCKENLAKYLKR